MPTAYYQVGGLYGHIQSTGNASKWGDEKPLARALAGSHSVLRNAEGKIEMVLGIDVSGASYLLVTEDEASALRVQYRRDKPKWARDFQALSPIYFDGPDDLAKKLGKLKLRSNKKNANGHPDTSQANFGYVGIDGRTEGIPRGEFELNRVFYRVVRGALDRKKYGLPHDFSLPESTRMCLLTFSIWEHGTDKEKRKTPKILDFAFGEVDLPSLQIKSGSSEYYVVKENSAHGSLKDRVPFTDGPTETLHSSVIGERISAFLARGPGPTVLMVFDEAATRTALQLMGVSKEVYGTSLRALLPRDSSTGSSNEPGPSRRGEYRNRRDGRRSRSPSPRRTHRDSPNQAYNARPKERNSHHPHQPVIIDVQQLYKCVRLGLSGPSPLKICSDLDVDTGKSSDAWGSALGLRVLLETWKAMASNVSIDEQTDYWLARPQRRAEAVGRGDRDAPQAAQFDPDDDDYDPNDIAPQIPSARMGGTSGGPASDVSDYDSD
ncbi:hypothetical protein D9611_005102 [Ephemerocybe angulata]|uniref:Uncharacterized protein n=1 Tax=Ephemerocybe angulata TaxID=980116 RepID=A0A8H5C2I6_9AGAR|nr:hypothetical protein D9611_005102 [Tulosesus angulatus]